MNDTSSSRFIGVVLRRSPRNLGIERFYYEVIAGMEQELRSRGMQVLLQVVNTLEDELESYRRWADSDKVMGVLMVDLIEGDPRAAVIDALGLPAVILGEPLTEGHQAVVSLDNYQAMADAVRQLAALGHVRIGRVTGPAPLLHTQARTQALEDVVAADGLSGASVEGDYSSASGVAGTRELLQSETPPTVIIYDNDVMAVAGLDVAHELGIAVPEELSLLAWDDSTLCLLASPRLSAMTHDVHQLGTFAANSLLALIDGQPTTTRIAPQPVFIQRGTTGPPPAGEGRVRDAALSVG
jgi:DNA-binding LacI/PurR family transcriptional regulator